MKMELEEMLRDKKKFVVGNQELTVAELRAEIDEMVKQGSKISIDKIEGNYWISFVHREGKCDTWIVSAE